MAKNAASEGALGTLHETLAKVLTTAISDKENPAPAAILAVAAKFLKDNDITCAVDKGNAMGGLQDALARNRAPSSAVDDATLKRSLEDVVNMDAYRNGSR